MLRAKGNVSFLQYFALYWGLAGYHSVLCTWCRIHFTPALIMSAYGFTAQGRYCRAGVPCRFCGVLWDHHHRRTKWLRAWLAKACNMLYVLPRHPWCARAACCLFVALRRRCSDDRDTMSCLVFAVMMLINATIWHLPIYLRDHRAMSLTLLHLQPGQNNR